MVAATAAAKATVVEADMAKVVMDKIVEVDTQIMGTEADSNHHTSRTHIKTMAEVVDNHKVEEVQIEVKIRLYSWEI
jgi:hypothetical protein